MAAYSPPIDLFEPAQTAVVVIDFNFKVLSANSAARKLLGEIPENLTCHALLCRKTDPCAECMLEAPAKQKAHTLIGPSGEEHFIREEVLRFPEFAVLFLLDVTRGITALRQLDLTRKELKARVVLAEQRRREEADEKERMARILDQLPEGVLLVDGEYQILRKNSAASEILPQKNGETCYAMLGKGAPCSGCPAAQGAASVGGRPISHQVGGRYVTEHRVSTEAGELLLFRDTTRQIQLIERIREQQETITRKSEILSNLVALQTKLQNAADPKEAVPPFLEVFLPLCRVESIVLIVDDIRPGCIWEMAHRGLPLPDAVKVTRGYLSREIQSGKTELLPEDALPWERTRQVVLTGGNGRRVGMMLYPDAGPEDQRAEEDLVPLFAEPLGAFIQNRLLQRQLEERANTDALTGLFNRGYLETALLGEKRKHEEFGIPYAVIMVDINGLKEVNDRCGHDAGDRLILAVSERLKGVIRNTDLVARIGGDEFVMLLPDTTEEGANLLSLRFSQKIFAGVTIEVGEGETFPVTASFGHAGSDQSPQDTLMAVADARMYADKKHHYETHARYR